MVFFKYFFNDCFSFLIIFKFKIAHFKRVFLNLSYISGINSRFVLFQLCLFFLVRLKANKTWIFIYHLTSTDQQNICISNVFATHRRTYVHLWELNCKTETTYGKWQRMLEVSAELISQFIQIYVLYNNNWS